jgi:hypothetical protein
MMDEIRFARYYSYRKARVVDAPVRLPVEAVAPLEQALVKAAGLSMCDNHTCFVFWASQKRQAVIFSDGTAYIADAPQLKVGEW